MIYYVLLRIYNFIGYICQEKSCRSKSEPILPPERLIFIPCLHTFEQCTLLTNGFIAVRPEIIIFQSHNTEPCKENCPEVILQNSRQVVERIEGSKESGMHQPQVRLNVAAHAGKGTNDT